MADKVTELKQERAGLVARMRTILDKADEEKRTALAGEEEQEYNRLEQEIDGLGRRIKLEEDLQARERELAARDGSIDPRATQGDPALGSGDEERAREYRETFLKYVRGGYSELTGDERKVLQSGKHEERADQIKGTNTLGGFLVPTEFERRLVEHQVQAGTMRQTRATVIRTAAGEDLQVPKTTAHGGATWLAEAAAITEDTETFGQVTLKAHVVARLIRVSIQLLGDNAVDLEAYLARELGRSIGAKQNDGYVKGDASSKPQGISGVSSLGVTAAANNAIAADELVDLYHSVGPQYRRDAEWMMADGTIKAIRKIKLSTGEYIWAPGLTAGEPDTLLGKPVHDDPDMAAIGANNKSILFGDFSAYWIRDAGGFVLRRLDERYAESLLVGFLAYTRTDGNLIDQSGAVKHLVHPA